MAKLNINLKNLRQDISWINLDVSGIHSVISEKTNLTIYNCNISGSLNSNFSKLIIDKQTNMFSNTFQHIYATNNSQIIALNNAIVNSDNNSIYNFNVPSSNIPILKKYDTIINEYIWNPYLCNDGNKFLWYESNNLSDYYYIPSQINEADQLIYNVNHVEQLKAFLQNLPKNLCGKTIIIYPIITDISDQHIIVSGFYNGTVKFYLNSFNDNNCLLQIIDIDNIQITMDPQTTVKPILRTKIRVQNVQNCIISGCVFSGDGIKNIDNINSIYYYNEKIDDIQNNTNKKLSNFIISIISSNVRLIECKFEHCNQTTIYCTLNSKLIARKNTFIYPFQITSTVNSFIRKPIIYYISKNSIGIATKDDIQLNGMTQLKFTQQQNNSIIKQEQNTNNTINFTYIYGYAYIGSIFNHQHKSKLLKRKQIRNVDLIKNKQLPIGSMYQIPINIAMKSLDGITNYQYIHENTIGYHYNTTSAYIGISYPSGYYKYKSHSNLDRGYTNMLKQFQQFNNLQLNTNNVFPQSKNMRRYTSYYADNIKYAQIFKHHFNLDTNPFFNLNLISSEIDTQYKLLVSVPSRLKFVYPQTNHTLAIQYNQFINYDKTIFKTNMEEDNI